MIRSRYEYKGFLKMIKSGMSFEMNLILQVKKLMPGKLE